MRLFSWLTLHLRDIPRKRKELEQAQDRLSNYLHSSKEGEMLYVLLLATSMTEKAKALRGVLDVQDRFILETMTRRDALKLELLTYGKGET